MAGSGLSVSLEQSTIIWWPCGLRNTGPKGPPPSDYRAQFKLQSRIAGLPSKFRVHDLRYTFGFTLRQRRVPIETIMGLMRHADIKETMIYAKYSDVEGAKTTTCLDGLYP